jgi:hypothetical protein
LEKIAQNIAQSFFDEMMNNFHHGKKYPQILDTFVIFEVNAGSKQSPKRRKFAQSGHSAKMRQNAPNMYACGRHKCGY